MPSPDYVREKLSMAMTLLATGAEPLQVRLRDAHDALHTLRPDDFPDPDDGDALQQVMSALTAVDPAGDEGSVVATTRRMSDQDAHRVAKLIDALHGRWFPL